MVSQPQSTTNSSGPSQQQIAVDHVADHHGQSTQSTTNSMDHVSDFTSHFSHFINIKEVNNSLLQVVPNWYVVNNANQMFVVMPHTQVVIKKEK